MRYPAYCTLPTHADVEAKAAIDAQILGDPDPAAAAAALLETFPRQTGTIVADLRARGFDASLDRVTYAIKRGELEAPAAHDARGNRLWQPADIDRAAEYFLAQGMLVPGAQARTVDNVCALQQHEALEHARAAHPHVHPEMFVQIVLPGLAGRDVPSRVYFRPMTPEEEASLREAIDAAPQDQAAWVAFHRRQRERGMHP